MQFASKTSLNIRILPAVLPKEQELWYDVKEEFLSRAPHEQCFDPDDTELDFQLTKSPFAFTVVRKRNGDVLFSTEGSRLVFENQFIEFRTQLPPEYNIYGLGEVMHGFRLGNSYNRTFYATDVRLVLLFISLFLRPLTLMSIATHSTRTSTACTPSTSSTVTKPRATTQRKDMLTACICVMFTARRYFFVRNH